MAVKKRVPCSVFSRIVGYYAQVRHFNLGKKQEFSERRTFIIPSLNEAKGDGGSVQSV